MPNIEIKARYPDHAKARDIALRLNARHEGAETQVDTYFKTPRGRLKLRESSKHGALLIPYLRNDVTGPKKSDYMLVPVEKPEPLKSFLEKILGIDVVVEKKRDLYMIGNVRVHLDEVRGLGNFFELEAQYEWSDVVEREQAKVEKLLKEFQIAKADLISGSYRELVQESGRVQFSL